MNVKQKIKVVKKGVLLFATVAIVLAKCSTDNGKDEIEKFPNITILGPIEGILSELNVKPSNQKDITYILTYADSTSYKLVGGRMNNDAWLAKFDSDGNEIFSYQFENTFDEFGYSHVNFYSIKAINNDIIILLIFVVNTSDLAAITHAGSVLCVVDFNTGEELRQFSFSNKTEYDIVKTQFSYFLQSRDFGSSQISDFYSISLDGKKFWERSLNNTEKNGLNQYGYQFGRCIFLDDENIFYENGRIYKYRSINLKDYKLNYDTDIALTGENSLKENISYEIKGLSVNDVVRIEYSESYCETIVIVDSISGITQRTTECTLLKEYYDDIDKQTGQLISTNAPSF